MCTVLWERFTSNLSTDTNITKFGFRIGIKLDSGDETFIHHVAKVVVIDMTHKPVKLSDSKGFNG